MRYQQTLEIHQRLETVLQLIGTGKYSTPALAETVGVSIPTISRIVAALRVQGHDIKAERTNKGWRYVVVGEITPTGSKRRIAAKGSVDSEANPVIHLNMSGPNS